MNRSVSAARTILALAVALFYPGFALAQDVARTVVLEVEGGGTQRLEATLAEVPGVEIRTQDWFLDQVKKSGGKTKKIMSRPEDLRFVMISADIRYIVAIQGDEEQWSVAFFDDAGEPVKKMELARDGGELTIEEAQRIRGTLEDLLGIEPEPVVAQEAPTADAPPEREVAEVAPSPARPTTDAESLRLTAAAAMFKRDVSIAGENGAVLTFRSAFYPGARLEGAWFPGFGEFDALWLGFVVNGAVGFDTLVTEEESIPIRQIEAEGGVVLRSRGALSLEVAARHVRYQLPSNDFLPTLTATLLRAGVAFRESFGKWTVVAQADAVPVGFAGSHARLFGESAVMYGFGGEVHVGYAFSDRLGARVGNGFRLVRTDFAGQGSLEFRDTRAFELVWGPDVGITLAY